MRGDTISVLIMIALVVMSAYFSATETAFSSLSRSRIKILMEHGNRKAALVHKLSENYDKLLSTILVGNNIVNIALSSMATVFFIQYLGNASGPTISTVVVTIVVLIFGEITPKSLAKETPERFAMFSAPILQVFLAILTPINYIFSLWRKFMSRVVKVKDDRRVTDEELLTIVAEAEQEGGIDSEESELIRSAIEFNDQEAVDILTPRVNVVAVENTVSAEELETVFRESGLTRLPVYEDSIDNVLGIVNLKDFYACPRDAGFHVTDIMTEPVYISESMKIGALLKFLQKTKAHFAIVADEFGGMVGIITMEDILEELVGEIWDEHDEVVEEFVKLDDNKYRVLCSADLDKLFTFFSLDCEADSVTVSGWVMEELGRIPDEGDTFTYQNLTVEVTKTDHHRVLEITVTVDPDYQAEQAEEE
ncbi:MAG: hemolysin family protein [Clostridiaceae bacterium]|nr:hemolysin family protein [Clostridiaceae bacterium]